MFIFCPSATTFCSKLKNQSHSFFALWKKLCKVNFPGEITEVANKLPLSGLADYSRRQNNKNTAGGPKTQIQPEAKKQKYSRRPKNKNTAGGRKTKIQPEAQKQKYSRRQKNKNTAGNNETKNTITAERQQSENTAGQKYSRSGQAICQKNSRTKIQPELRDYTGTNQVWLRPKAKLLKVRLGILSFGRGRPPWVIGTSPTMMMTLMLMVMLMILLEKKTKCHNL